jgi:hypothetical protein
MKYLARLFGKRFDVANEACRVEAYLLFGRLYYWRFTPTFTQIVRKTLAEHSREIEARLSRDNAWLAKRREQQ